MLRHPEFDPPVLEERERLIQYFTDHENERIQIQTQAGKVKKIGNTSITDYIHVLKDMPRSQAVKYILLACLTLGLHAGAVCESPQSGHNAAAGNVLQRLYPHEGRQKRGAVSQLLRCILKLLKAAERLRNIRNPQIQSYLDRIAAARKSMKDSAEAPSW